MCEVAAFSLLQVSCSEAYQLFETSWGCTFLHGRCVIKYVYNIYIRKNVHICRYTCICRCSTTSSQVIAVCLTPGYWETLAHKDQHMKLLMTECVSNQPMKLVESTPFHPATVANEGLFRICYPKNFNVILGGFQLFLPECHLQSLASDPVQSDLPDFAR